MKVYIVSAKDFKDREKYDEVYKNASVTRQKKMEKSRTENSMALSCAASYLISLGLEEYGFSERDARYIENEHGKPELENFDVHFNVSHSGDYAVCAFSKKEVGVDIEENNKNRDIMSLSERFFSKREYEAVKASPDGVGVFYKIWTRKESFLKATGMGITVTLSDVDVLDDAKIYNGRKYKFFEYTNLAGYSMCVCGEEDNIDFIGV